MPKVDAAKIFENGETTEYAGKAIVALATGLYYHASIFTVLFWSWCFIPTVFLQESCFISIYLIYNCQVRERFVYIIFFICVYFRSKHYEEVW